MRFWVHAKLLYDVVVGSETTMSDNERRGNGVIVLGLLAAVFTFLTAAMGFFEKWRDSNKPSPPSQVVQATQTFPSTAPRGVAARPRGSTKIIDRAPVMVRDPGIAPRLIPQRPIPQLPSSDYSPKESAAESSMSQTASCPNLSGHWVSGSGGGLSMDIAESGCKLASDNADSRIGFHHTVRGSWDPAQYSFSWNVARLDPRHCWSRLYGRATMTGPSTLSVNYSGSDGRCGMPANFTDHGVFTRQ